MKGENIKDSVAKKAAWQVLIVLLVAMIILYAGAFFAVSRAVFSVNNSLSLTILDLYTEYLTEYSNNNQVPLDKNISAKIIEYGDFICSKYETDYIYLYTIDEDAGSIRYIAASVLSNKEEKGIKDNMVDRLVECEFFPDELAVWHGVKESATLSYDNSFGHEITTLKLIHDCNGNKIIAAVETSYDYIYNQIFSSFSVLAVSVTLVLICIGISIYYFIRKRISLPAKKISNSMQEYIYDGKHNENKLSVKGNDEFSMIARAFNSMTDDITSYVDSIKTLSEENANRNAELNIAAEIQRGFLPAPVFENEDCSIKAMMIPAKDIGGDLYDYIPLGNGRYLVVVADVSGKGVSAALFMSMALTLIRQFARMGLMPDEILKKTNNALAENNSRMLFVTAFIGIYDSNDYTFTFSNAGHNLPYKICREAQSLDTSTGVLMGIFENEDFTSEKITLNPGETIFMYTDGVTEAINKEKKFWGNDGLEKAIRSYHPFCKKSLIDYIYDKTTEFSENEEQHDDITLLSLTAKSNVELELDYDIHELEKIRAEIIKLSVPHSMKLNLCLATEELFVNICNYAFEGKAPENKKIGFFMSVSDRIEIRFSDNGIRYNPLENIEIPDSDDDDLQIGGLGRFLSSSLTDDAEYQFIDGKNILTLFKYFEEENI